MTTQSIPGKMGKTEEPLILRRKFKHYLLFYVLSYLTTILIWGLEVLTCYLIAIHIEPGINFWAVLSALAVGNVMKAIPLLPGGLGTYEAGFILVLTLYGASYETAVSLSIIDHLLKKIVNLVVGFPVYLGLQRTSLLSKAEE